MRPAPHVTVTGRIKRPCPESFIEALQRAVEPSTPAWSNRAWDSFIAGLRQCPQRRRDLVEVVGDELAEFMEGR